MLDDPPSGGFVKTEVLSPGAHLLDIFDFLKVLLDPR